MNKPNIRLLLGAGIVILALGMYLFIDTVRFNEMAVVTTFGRASQEDVRENPGAFLKIPIVNSVTKYDTRARVVTTQSVTQQTADSRPLILQAFCVWRVDDPLRFFQAFSNAGPRAVDHFRKAEMEVLRDNLRSALSEVGQFPMNKLFTESDSEIPVLEARIKDALISRGGGEAEATASLADQGIEVMFVGIAKALLPQSTTQSVFKRMESSRIARVTSLQARGQSEADAIVAKAEADARRIRQFALARAAEIKSRGDEEAQVFIAQLNENPELAVFLRNMDLVKEVLAKKVTLVLSDSAPGLGVLSPSAGASLKAGDIPGVAWIGNLFTGLSGSEIANSGDTSLPVGSLEPGEGGGDPQ